MTNFVNYTQMKNMRVHFTIALLVVAMISCGGRGRETNKGTGGEAPPSAAAAQQGRPAPVKHYTYRVVGEYPHDTGSYTQGLFWHDGYLYEGTGQYGESRLMKVDPETGRALQTVKLARNYFGEGITLHGGYIYQITWYERRCFVYDAATLKQVKTFSYQGQGWGITSDGQKLYMSDGSNVISVRDPGTFAVERTIPVMIGRNRQTSINELEWIGGEIWANIYGTDNIVRIDPQTGYVTGLIDLKGLQAKEDFRPGVTDVLNGIACDPDTGNIYVTGKYWNKLYRIEVVEKK